MTLYRSLRPESPACCPECKATEFRWDAGYKGSLTEPPEPSCWRCVYCENTSEITEGYTMTQHTHTPGPWRVGIAAGTIVSDSGKIANAHCYGVVPDAEQRANTARIVACVNACEGISNEALSLGGPFAAAKAAIVQRDALLAALEDAEFLLRKAAQLAGPMQDSFGRSAADARAALAAARGEG